MEKTTKKFNETLLLRTTGCFATGVTVFAFHHAGKIHGLTVNSFTSVSLSPPLILVSIAKTTTMHKMLIKNIPSNRLNTNIEKLLNISIGISILSKEQKNISHHFAGKPLGHGYSYSPTFSIDKHACPIIRNCHASLSTKLYSVTDTGDHSLILAKVLSSSRNERLAPLIFYRGEYYNLES